MARLLHTSDTHLGYRQYHLDERLRDFADAFSEVVTAAIDHDVDAVVHAGDLFHTSRPGITPLQTVLTELQRLQRADIPFLLIVGNHERTHGRNWVELLEEIGLATRLDYKGTEIADTTLYGQDHVPLGQRDRLDYQFEPPETQSAVLVGHGLFTPFGHGDWDSREILSRSPVAFDLMLVGDDHVPHHAFVGGRSSGTDDQSDPVDQIADESSEPRPSIDRKIPISYAGSTERTKADQRNARSYSLVTVPADGEVDPDEHIERHDIQSARPFVYVDIELQPGDGLEVVQEAIRDHVDSPLDGAVLKVTLTAAEKSDSANDETNSVDEGSDVEAAVHERIPEGPIENLGTELGALITRVGDRRSFFEDDREYEAVEFADIDAAVEERRRHMEVSEPADQLLEMALSPDQTPDTQVADAAQETVTDLLGEMPTSAFHIGEEGDLDHEMPEPDSEEDLPAEDILSELVD